MHSINRKRSLQIVLICVTLLSIVRFVVEIPPTFVSTNVMQGFNITIVRHTFDEAVNPIHKVGNINFVTHITQQLTNSFHKSENITGVSSNQSFVYSNPILKEKANISKIDFREIRGELQMMQREKMVEAMLERLNKLNKNGANDTEDNTSDIEAYYTLPRDVKTSLNYKLILSNPRLCLVNTFMVLLVPSSASKFEARQGIRSTYGRFGSDKPVYSSRSRSNVNISTVFVVGHSVDDMVNERVKQEFEEYKDLVVVDFIDSYFNLTLKVLLGLKWIRDNCKEVQYVLKVDDDVFVNVPLLIQTIEKYPLMDNGAVFGTIISITKELRVVHGEEKWGINETEYPLKHYPPYAQGTSYTITGNLVSKIVNTSQYLSYLHIEDAFITGIIASKIHGAKLVRILRSSNWGDSNPKPCVFIGTRRVAQTKMSPKLMTQVWDTLDNPDKCIGRYQYLHPLKAKQQK